MLKGGEGKEGGGEQVCEGEGLEEGGIDERGV